MALKDFWIRIRNGLRFSRQHRVISDAQRYEKDELAQAMAGSDMWCSARSVADYREEDFAFLPSAERIALTEHVQAFRAIASEFDPAKPAGPAQRDAAFPHFKAIVEQLEFDRFADAEAYRVGKIAEADPRFPRDLVEDARYRTTMDSNGEPAIKIMGYIKDAEKKHFLAYARQVRKAIEDIVFELGQPYWPHVSTRLVSDLAELPAVGAG